MKLSEMAYDDIQLEQRVISDNTGKLGKVTDKWLNPGDRWDERYVHIKWDGGTETMNWLSWMNEITVVKE